jgi:hypothetical protein
LFAYYHTFNIAHEVTNVGTDWSQLARVAKETKTTLEAASLDVVADRGYFNGEEILACEEAGITVTLPKPMISSSRRKGASVSRTSDMGISLRRVSDELAAAGRVNRLGQPFTAVQIERIVKAS